MGLQNLARESRVRSGSGSPGRGQFVCSGKFRERVRGGCLCFNSTILVDAALCRFRKVLFTDIFLLSSELCAARLYSGFTSVSAASQVLRTQIPELRYLFPWSVQATAGKDETPFPFNCKPVQCWFLFCSALLGTFLLIMTSVSEIASVSHNRMLLLNLALTE